MDPGDLPPPIRQGNRREWGGGGGQRRAARLQELAWLGIDGGPPTCSSSLALRTEAGTQLLVGCGLGLWLVHAPRASFQPEALEAVQLKLKGMPSHDLGLRIVSICAVPPDNKKSCPAVAVAVAPSNDMDVEGCAVYLYGGDLDAGASVLEMANSVQCLPLEVIPVLVKSLAWLEKGGVAKGAAAFQHALIVCGCNCTCEAWVRDAGGMFSPSGEGGMDSHLPELKLLREISPVMSMDVKYVGYERHMAAGGIHGGLFFSVVDMRSGEILWSSLIHLDGPVPSVALFSSSRHLDAATCGPPELEVGVYKTSPEEAVHHAHSAEKGIVDAHLVACSALGFAVIYPDVSNVGFQGGSALPGMSCGEHDSVISACGADLDLDGRVEAVLGTYGGHVMQYCLEEIYGDDEDDIGLSQRNDQSQRDMSPEGEQDAALSADHTADWKVLEDAAVERMAGTGTHVASQGTRGKRRSFILTRPKSRSSLLQSRSSSDSEDNDRAERSRATTTWSGLSPWTVQQRTSIATQSEAASANMKSLDVPAESLQHSVSAPGIHFTPHALSGGSNRSPRQRHARGDGCDFRTGWLKKASDLSSRATLAQVLQAGGAVYGMHWVDLTADGMRELAIVLHNGVRILQPDLRHATERLRYALDQLLNLRELEEAALNHGSELHSLQDAVRRAPKSSPKRGYFV